MTLALQVTPESPEGFVLIPGISAATQTNLILSAIVLLFVFLARRGILALVHRHSLRLEMAIAAAYRRSVPGPWGESAIEA